MTLRLREKGCSGIVLEAARRFADDELTETSWDYRQFRWAPGWAGSGCSAATCSVKCPSSREQGSAAGR